MRVYIRAEHLITGLGITYQENFEELQAARRGLSHVMYPELGGQHFWVSKIDRDRLHLRSKDLMIPSDLTWLEHLLLVSMTKAIEQAGVDPASPDTLTIIASTKGNIDLLDSAEIYDRDHPVHMMSISRTVAGHFGISHLPCILSNACTSGLMAISMAARLLDEGRYRNAIVAGIDVLSPFTLAGFQALGAIDPDPCRPYDTARAGINLGEACGTMVLSVDQKFADLVITGTGSSNDANHISGPSRTGSGLIQAISLAMNESGVSSVDAINAHGTATLYNDEMEAQALHQLGMHDVPVHSSKGFWGHTLGAAGVIELISMTMCMRNNLLYPSVGFESNGLTLPLNVVDKTMNVSLGTCLKTSSGFGGSNSALIIEMA